jgi:pyrroline-5-carboxylate reductase
MKIGFLGVGTVSTAVIEAMASRGGMQKTIYLSPRGEKRSTDLAAKFDHCIRLESNQAVIDASDMVVLSMLPNQVDEALAELTFREDQIIASFIAGTPPSGIAKLTAPATQVSQLIPLPAIVHHKGPLVICPSHPDVVREFAGLGDIVILEDETKIRILSVSSAMMSTYFTFQNTIIKWTEDSGIDHDTASQYVRSLLEGLAIEGQAATDAEIPHLPVEHETPGGLNFRNRTGLEQDGWFDALYARLQDTYSNANLKAKSSE